MRRSIAIAFLLVVPACKFGQSSAVKEESQDAGPQQTVHGQRLPAATVSEILIALNTTAEGPGGSDSAVALTPVAPGSTTGLSLQAGATPYMEKCTANQVPIPPSWLDPAQPGTINPLWVKITTLDRSRIFALDPNWETTLYAYTDPNGLGTCAALPRGPTGKHAVQLEALGMICQGRNGKSCFWDNKEVTVSRDDKGLPFQNALSDLRDIRPEFMADGDNLIENCSQCHRGDNIFIIHEDTDMTKLPGRIPDQKAEPISDQPTWSNPTGSKKLAANCQDGSCHNSFPELNFAYCNNVLMPSLKSTRWEFDRNTTQWVAVDIHDGKGPPMPPKDQVVVDSYAGDISEIEIACKAYYRRAKQDWPW